MAIEVAETGGPVFWPMSKPLPRTRCRREVPIRADAIGVNYIDTYFRSGTYARRLPASSSAAASMWDGGGGRRTSPPSTSATGLVTDSYRMALRRILHGRRAVSAYVPESAPPTKLLPHLLKGMTAHHLDQNLCIQVQPRDFLRLIARGAGGVGTDPHSSGRTAARCESSPWHQPRKAEFSRRAGAVESSTPDRMRPTRPRSVISPKAAVLPPSQTASGSPRSTPVWRVWPVRSTVALFGASSGPVPPVDPQRLNAAGR